MLDMRFVDRLDLAQEARALLPVTLRPFLVAPDLASPVISVDVTDPDVLYAVQDALAPFFARHTVRGYYDAAAAVPMPRRDVPRAESPNATLMMDLDADDSIVPGDDRSSGPEIVVGDSEDGRRRRRRGRPVTVGDPMAKRAVRADADYEEYAWMDTPPYSDHKDAIAELRDAMEWPDPFTERWERLNTEWDRKDMADRIIEYKNQYADSLPPFDVERALTAPPAWWTQPPYSDHPELLGIGGAVVWPDPESGALVSLTSDADRKELADRIIARQ